MLQTSFTNITAEFCDQVSLENTKLNWESFQNPLVCC